MRRSLIWILLATLAMSAVAIFMPGHTPDLAGAVTATPVTLAQLSDSARAAAPLAASPVAAALPANLPAPALEPAKRDIFGLATPVAPSPPPAPVAAPIDQPPVAAPPPAAPMNYRYWGRMKTPEGQQISYLVKGDDRGDNVLPIAPGTELGDGWQVESMGEDSVALVYPALQQRVVIPIAPAQIE